MEQYKKLSAELKIQENIGNMLFQLLKESSYEDSEELRIQVVLTNRKIIDLYQKIQESILNPE